MNIHDSALFQFWRISFFFTVDLPLNSKLKKNLHPKYFLFLCHSCICSTYTCVWYHIWCNYLKFYQNVIKWFIFWIVKTKGTVLTKQILRFFILNIFQAFIWCFLEGSSFMLFTEKMEINIVRVIFMRSYTGIYKTDILLKLKTMLKLVQSEKNTIKSRNLQPKSSLSYYM